MTKSDNMTSIDKLRCELEKIMRDLNEEDIEKYVKALCFSYYKSIMQKDCKELEKTCESLKMLIYVYLARFPQIETYINYCLVTSANMIMSQVFEIDCKMWKPEEISLSSHNEMASLTRVFERSRKQFVSLEDMSNISKLKSLIENDEKDNDEMLSLINKLYDNCVYEFEEVR